MKSAIFFDRDDTLIKDSGYMNDSSRIRYMEEVFDALNLLKDTFDFFVVTNQSGIPRGLVQEENLFKIHEQIAMDFKVHNIQIKEFLWAPYLPDSHHYYRKPRPGMILEILNVYNYKPKNCWMIGDRESDIVAAKSACVNSILLNSQPLNKNLNPNFHTSSLYEAAQFILKSQSSL